MAKEVKKHSKVTLFSEKDCTGWQTGLGTMDPELVKIPFIGLTRYTLSLPWSPVHEGPGWWDRSQGLSWCVFPKMDFEKLYAFMYRTTYAFGKFVMVDLNGFIKKPEPAVLYERMEWPMPVGMLTESALPGVNGRVVLFDPVHDRNWRALWLADFTQNEKRPVEDMDILHAKPIQINPGRGESHPTVRTLVETISSSEPRGRGLRALFEPSPLSTTNPCSEVPIEGTESQSERPETGQH